MNRQQFRMEVKEITPLGTFEGLLSVYNNVDSYGEIVMPGAFTKTIKEHGSQIPMLWQHKSDVPIGSLTLQDGPQALAVQGQLLMELPEAQKAYLLMKAKIVNGLSIGFSTIKDTVEGGVRKLKELRLFEGSVVTFPANESCLISAVKHHQQVKGDFTEEMSEIQIQEMGYQMRSALFNALGSIPWSSGMSKDEKVSAAETVIQQFSEAFLDYLPKYIDWLSVEYGAEYGMMGAQPGEVKSGRVISTANKTTLTTAHEHMKSAMDLIYPLIDEADDESEYDEEDIGVTGKSKAGTVAEVQSAPVPDHSAIVGLIDKLQQAVLTRS